MRNITKYFLFILDELLFVIIAIITMHYLNVSFDIFIFLLVIIIIGFVFISYVFLPQLKKPVTGSEGLIGMKGIALESFNNQGRVRVHGEQWKAVTKNGLIKKNDEIKIVDVHGLTVTVEKL
jgi:membrane-bound serine protease (ClpP class)